MRTLSVRDIKKVIGATTTVVRERLTVYRLTPSLKVGGRRGAREGAPDSAWVLWKMNGLTRDGMAEPLSRENICPAGANEDGTDVK